LDKEDSYYKFNFKVGQPLNLIWGYKFLGIDPATGTPMYDGFNLDGTKKSPTDPFGGRQIIGNYSPKYYGGFINSFNYKGFSLEVFFQFVDGLASVNGLYDLNNSSSTTNNQVLEVLNRWQKPGMITNVPRLATSSSAWWISSSIDRQSSRFLSGASYVRLKNATLAYDIPAGILSRLKIRSMNVYVTGHNLVTWTKFNGIDPETGSNVAPVQMLIGGIRLGL
jgi:TonB-dependent starch-binding outer membrane protein SusC